MTKKTNTNLEGFGKRLAKVRKECGYTQQKLADEIGISRRMLVYYESQTNHPPTSILPNLVNALNISIDELLGISTLSKEYSPKNTYFWKQIQKAELLPSADRKALLQILDGLLSKNKLKEA